MVSAGLAVSLAKWTIDVAWRYTDHGSIETATGIARKVCRIAGCRLPDIDLPLAPTLGELTEPRGSRCPCAMPFDVRHCGCTGSVRRYRKRMLNNLIAYNQPSSCGTRQRGQFVKNTTRYDDDFYDWTQATAALIRQRKWRDIDWEHLAEELEALGKRDRREFESRLVTLMLHLLKWRFQPERRQRGRGWQRTILEQRRQLAALLCGQSWSAPGNARRPGPALSTRPPAGCGGNRTARGNVSHRLSLDRLPDPQYPFLAGKRTRSEMNLL